MSLQPCPRSLFQSVGLKRGSREAGGFSWFFKGPTTALRTQSSWVPPFCSTPSPPLSPGWPAALPLPPPPLPPPPPLLGPLIKAGLSATAAHQGAPHPHLQQHCLLGALLWCTHSHKHTGANAGTHTQIRPDPHTPKKILLISKDKAKQMKPRTQG